MRVGIPSEMFPKKDLTDFSTKMTKKCLSRNFQKEWGKAELYFTNEIDVENETVNWPF